MSLRDPRFRLIQRRLANLGLYALPIDDEFGDGMDSGISRALAELERLHDAPALQAEEAAAATGDAAAIRAKLPAHHRWLADEFDSLPRHMKVALMLHGTIETPGSGNSATIMGWASELRAAGIPVTGYSADSVPWCGLFAAIVMHLAGRPVVKDPLWALNWSKWGEDGGAPELGDLVTFKRDGGGHVGFVIGIDKEGYIHTLGGNQSDKVNIMRIALTRMHACRQPAYRTKPASVRHVIVAANGAVSKNEA